jgi:hypothetical protein
VLSLDEYFVLLGQSTSLFDQDMPDFAVGDVSIAVRASYTYC